MRCRRKKREGENGAVRRIELGKKQSEGGARGEDFGLARDLIGQRARMWERCKADSRIPVYGRSGYWRKVQRKFSLFYLLFNRTENERASNLCLLLSDMLV
jgi:hypothetical protein